MLILRCPGLLGVRIQKLPFFSKREERESKRKQQAYWAEPGARFRASGRLSSGSSAAPAGMRGDSPRSPTAGPRWGCCPLLHQPLQGLTPRATTSARLLPTGGGVGSAPRVRVSLKAESAGRRRGSRRGAAWAAEADAGSVGRAGSRVPRLAQPRGACLSPESPAISGGSAGGPNPGRAARVRLQRAPVVARHPGSPQNSPPSRKTF